MTPRPTELLLLLLLAAASCSREPATDAPASAPTTPADTAGSVEEGRTFERNIVFLSERRDSVLLVPWLITAHTIPGGVRREARGLLARGGSWEQFFTDAWQTPPTRQPWRVIPHGQMRLVVGEDDQVQEILFDEGPRQLEVALENQNPLAEWSGQHGETVRLLDGSVVLAGARVPGLVMDLTRGRQAREAPSGDWALLTDSDSLRLVLQAPAFADPGSAGAFRAWALMGDQELDWPSVTVAWTETRAFERARRDVPVKLTGTSSAGDLRVELTVRTAELQAGVGEGPQLPVDAFFEVQGTVRMGNESYPVRGVLRHLQP
jgi:hypothetical protein